MVPISRVVFSCSFSRVLQECLNCLLQVVADLDALTLCPVVLLFEASDGEGPEVQPGCLLANGLTSSNRAVHPKCTAQLLLPHLPVLSLMQKALLSWPQKGKLCNVLITSFSLFAKA